MSREATAVTILRDLWADEGCSWTAEHTGYGQDQGAWVVALQWQTDTVPFHDSDWLDVTWQFYGERIVEALEAAAEWCAQLAPWALCPECDGHGQWNGVGCPACGTTGLARQVVSA